MYLNICSNCPLFVKNNYVNHRSNRFHWTYCTLHTVCTLWTELIFNILREGFHGLPLYVICTEQQGDSVKIYFWIGYLRIRPKNWAFVNWVLQRVRATQLSAAKLSVSKLSASKSKGYKTERSKVEHLYG